MGDSRSSCSSCCPASRWPCRRPATAGGSTRSPASRARRARRILPPYWAALVFSLAVAWLVVPPPGQGAPDAESVVVNGLLDPEPRPRAEPGPIVLVDRRRGPAVRAVPALAADGPPVGRRRDGCRRHARRSHGRDRRSARPPPGRLRDPVAARPRRALRGRRPGRRHRGRERRLAGRGRGRGSRSPPQRRCSRRSGGRVRRGRSTTCSGSTSRSAPPSRACWPVWPPAIRHRLLRLLDVRPMRSLGSSSYSLYLTHGPIVVVVYERGRRRPRPPGCSGIPRHARARRAADDRVRAGVRVGVRDPVPSASHPNGSAAHRNAA